MLSARVLADEFPGEGLVEQWRELLDDAEFATPFQTPGWLCAWWTHFSRNKVPHWLVVEEGRDLVGLYPLYRTQAPWRALRAIGTGQSDYLHPLARRGYRDAVSRAVADHLESLRGVDLIDLQQIRKGTLHAIADDAPEEQATCLVLDLPNDYSEYLRGLSKSLRFDCRRLDKEPFASGTARISDVTEERTDEAMDVFFDLHARRWRSRWQPGAFATPRLRSFHRDVARALARDGQLRASVLEVEGRPAGVIYGMRVGSSRFFYQCGFEPEHKALSPGTLLVADSIQKAVGEGCGAYDFMRGDEPYKRRWNPQHSHPNLRYILPLNSRLGRVGRAFNHAGSKVEETVRSRLEGRSLFGR